MSSSGDERPSFGGLGRRAWQAEDGAAAAAEAPPNKKARTGATSSFAAKMMAKMGYQEGQGLGAAGTGRLAPIDVQLRPEGAGLGLVREKTQQMKAAERREAEQQGQQYHDSSEEERRQRKERKERKKAEKAAGQGTAAAAVPGARPKKPKYRTVVEIERDLKGLEVPDALKGLVDITGKETTFSTSNFAPAETEASKIAKRAQRDLEAYAETWRALQEEKQFHQTESMQLVAELDRQNGEKQELKNVIEAVGGLDLSAETELSDEARWETLTERLEALQADHPASLSKFDLREGAVAAIEPLFRKAMTLWEPLEQPHYLVAYLARLSHILGVTVDSAEPNAVAARKSDITVPPRRGKTTTSYESLLYQQWLPPVRRAVAAWAVEDPPPLLELYRAWQPLLPSFVRANFLTQLLLPRLTAALDAWKPGLARPHRRSHHHRRHHDPPQTTASPDTWLIEWLPHLPAFHQDPARDGALLHAVKRKLRGLLARHDVGAGPPAYLAPWQPLLGPAAHAHLLTAHLLPRLGTYLARNFELDPADQAPTLPAFAAVCAHAPPLPPAALGEVLARHFFPAFQATLHAWLTGDAPVHAEIADWLEWWRAQVPAAVLRTRAVERAWAAALHLVNDALDLGARAAAELPAPGDGDGGAARSDAPAPTPAPAPAPTGPEKAAELPPVTFQDVVEDWAEQEELLLLPLRAAHPEHGAPLFRLTASATGKGGCVLCFRGDVAWVRAGRDDRGRWEPVGLDELGAKASR